MSVFELIMLLCFGAAWPFSIIKSYRSRQNEGKSIIFLYIVFVGYMAGIAHKLTRNPDFVIYFYVLNALMVSADIILYYRNSLIERTDAK